MNTRRLFAAAAGLALGLWGASTFATLVITIDTGNSAVTGSGPYATVSVTRTSATTADIIFNSLTNGGFLYRMGNGGAADLNVNGPYSLGAVTESGTAGGFTPSFNNNTPGNVNGFGVFNLSLNNNDGFTDSATQISFTLTLTSGTWANDAAVLTPNSNGAVAAVHVFGCATPCLQANGAAFTGFAAGSGGSTPPREVPEPSALGLLSIGLLSLGLMATRRRRS